LINRAIHYNQRFYKSNSMDKKLELLKRNIIWLLVRNGIKARESVQSVRTSLATAFNSKTLELQWLNSLATREQLVNRLHQEIQYNGLIHSISSSTVVTLYLNSCRIHRRIDKRFTTNSGNYVAMRLL